MRIRCRICKFECDEQEHETMTLHLWETHTQRVREYVKSKKESGN